MSKHTKGPWKIGAPGPNGCYTIGTERGLMTAMIAHSICEPDQVEEAKANAALIAAAPELLEALMTLVLFTNLKPSVAAALADAHRVINKATSISN